MDTLSKTKKVLFWLHYFAIAACVVLTIVFAMLAVWAPREYDDYYKVAGDRLPVADNYAATAAVIFGLGFVLAFGMTFWSMYFDSLDSDRRHQEFVDDLDLRRRTLEIDHEKWLAEQPDPEPEPPTDDEHVDQAVALTKDDGS